MIATCILVACNSGASDVELVEKAKNYMAEKQVREASIELKNALQVNPKNAEARYLRGELNLQIGDLATAEKEFQRALEMGWNAEAAVMGKMRAMIAQRKYKEVLESSNTTDGWSATAQANLLALEAVAHAGKGDLLKAKNIVLSAEKLDANAYDVLKTTLLLQLAEKQKKDAEATLSNALKLFPDNPELMLMSANLAILNKQNDEAVRVFEQIIKSGPDKVMTLNVKRAHLGVLKLAVLGKDFERVQKTRDVFIAKNINDPEVNYFLAVAAFEEKKFDQAEEYLQKILKISSSHGPTLLLSGSVSYAKRDFEKAAYYLSKYVANYPENNKARKLLGRAYLALGQNEEAQAEFNSALNENADDAELIALVGLSEIGDGQLQSGIAEFEKALAMAPDSSSLKLELAKAYISAGETENAISQLNKILAEGGNKNQAEVLKVSAYLRVKQYDQAIIVALDILERSPQDAAVLSLVGNVFAASGDRVEARKYFNQALEIQPGNIQATMLLAAIEEVDSNTAEAEKLYKSLIKNDVTSTNPLLALARLSENKKDYKAMVAWLEKASENAPMELRPKTILAEYYLRENKLDKVEGLVQQATAISANDPAVLFIRGKMLIRQKQFNKAVSPLTELVTRKPDLALARSLLGETYLNLQQTDDARHQLELVLEKQPYYVPALLVLARVEQAEKHYAQGLEHVEKIIKVQPEFYQAHYLAGDISMSAKDYVAASDYYQKVMSIKPNSATAIKAAEAFSRMAQHQQAINTLKQWLSDNPEDVRARQYLGNAYLNNDDKKDAMQAYEVVYARQPENVAALNNLAWLYSLENDKRALEFAEKAYKAWPEDSGVQDTYGWILLQQGEVEKGRRMLEQVIKVLPEVPEVQYHYAVALLRSGDEKGARQILKKLLEDGKSFEGREEAQRLLD